MVHRYFSLLFVVITSSLSTAYSNPKADIHPAIERIYPALVRIHVVMEEGSGGRMRKHQAVGSGSIISSDGYILTNHHVAGRGTRFLCTLSNREEIDATLVGTDALSDLCVIKLDLSTRRNKDEPLAVATFGDSDQLKVGEVVLAMGSPGGLSQSVTRGIVANTAMIVPKNMNGMSLDGEKVGELVRWIGHDAVIFGGNSGGPLVNLDGEIIGVNEVGIASLGGAIPSNLAKKVAAELIAHGKITRSWIGLEPQPLLRHAEKAQGTLVSAVWKGSPADKAGIKAGDFITSYQGQPIPECHAPEDLPIFNAMVLETKPGTEVTLKGLRHGKDMTWTLVTEEREPRLDKESESHNWGLTVRDLTKVSALERRRKDTRGVLVDTVKMTGPSGQGKPNLRRDDVIRRLNNTEIANVEAFEKFTAELTKGLKKPTPVLVEFERSLKSYVTVIQVGPEPDAYRTRNADKAWLGASLQVLTRDLATALDLKNKKGVRLTEVISDSPAGKAGLEVGDILLKLDGRVINAHRPGDRGVLPGLIRAYPVDASVTFDLVRKGQAMKITVPLEARSQSETQLAEFADDRFEFTASELSDDHQRRIKTDHGSGQGILIEKVVANGWAALGGLATNDVVLNVNGEPVTSLDMLKETLLGFRQSRPRSVIFFVQRGPRTLFVEIEPWW